MEITPDKIVFLRAGPFSLNATIVFTWIIMALIVAVSLLATRNLSTETKLSRWQNLLEVIITGMKDQIYAICHQKPLRYLPLIGTLFLFIAVSVLLTIVPGYIPPTGSLSTTAALAICVFIAVPIYGIAERGFIGYIKRYLRPTPFMLPFNVLGEISRTIALAVRLFGNIMSGTIVVAILLSIIPFFFPILMQVLGLITGMLQAYIFAVLSMVYIASATRAYRQKEQTNRKE